jgi:Domain of unknown function (DUF4350)
MTGPAPVLTGPGPDAATPAGAAAPGSASGAGTRLAGQAGPPPHGPLHRWRAPLAVLVLVLLGGIVIALITPSPPTTGYLDPGNPGPQGTRALADLLAQRGQTVVRADSVTAALAAARAGDPDAAAGAGPGRQAGPGHAPALVITSPYLLSRAQLADLARLPGNVMVAEPDGAVLAALNQQAAVPAGTTGAAGTTGPAGAAGPQVTVAGAGEVRPVRPGCPLSAAAVAGDAVMGGVLLRVSSAAASGTGATRATAPAAAPAAAAAECYRVDGHPTLVRYQAAGRTVTVLGSGVPLTNAALAHRGNAALTLNLLRGSPRIVWLVPSPPALTPAGQKSLFQEIPGPAYLVTLQLFVAAGLAALWRTRRLGPLVAEPLPVVVRASETVEGHGRLYRSRRSRGRAAAVLRDAARHRIMSRLALPADADAGAVSAAVAAVTGRDPGAVQAILYGPVPRDDAALVALGQDIDALEGEVRTQ